MGVLVSYLSEFLRTALGGTGVENLTELAICIPVGVGIFYSMCRLTRVPELELATTAVATAGL